MVTIEPRLPRYRFNPVRLRKLALQARTLRPEVPGAATRAAVTLAARVHVEAPTPSPLLWFDQLSSGSIACLTAAPGLTQDWHRAYSIWCRRQGEQAVNCQHFCRALVIHRGLATARKRYRAGSGIVGPHTFLMIEPTTTTDAAPAEGSETETFTAYVEDLRAKLDRYRVSPPAEIAVKAEFSAAVHPRVRGRGQKEKGST